MTDKLQCQHLKRKIEYYSNSMNRNYVVNNMLKYMFSTNASGATLNKVISSSFESLLSIKLLISFNGIFPALQKNTLQACVLFLSEERERYVFH